MLFHGAHEFVNSGAIPRKERISSRKRKPAPVDARVVQIADNLLGKLIRERMSRSRIPGAGIVTLRAAVFTSGYKERATGTGPIDYV